MREQERVPEQRQNQIQIERCAQSVHPSISRGRVTSFREAEELVKKQIGYAKFTGVRRDESIKLTCIVRVMADMMVKAPGVSVTVDGEKMTAGVVQEVYSMVSERMVRSLMRSIDVGSLANPKAYIRTALYNEVIAAGMTNEFAACEMAEDEAETY